ncbi:MAG: 30S ribosomal protein S20 [Thermodesulfobacteriota bacterium]
MANHASALKRVRQSEKRSLRNKSRKTAVKTVTKRLEAMISESKPEEAAGQFKKAQKMIAKNAAKGVFHRKTASRKISRMAKRLNSITSS